MVQLIANNGPLPAEFLDHDLTGGWSGYREFHAGGDLLVIYLLKEKEDAIIFTRIGTHAELFE